MQAVPIGPLVFAGDRLAAIIGIGVFMIVTLILSTRFEPRISRWSTWTLVAGLAAARAGHVMTNAGSFADEPERILAMWQGGFSWQGGVVGIALASAALVRTSRVAIGAVVSLGVALFAWNVVWQLTNTASSKALPDFALERLEGGSAVPSSFVGKATVVNLWASWCPPCRREMPVMAEMAASRTDVEFLFVNQGEGRAAIERYLASQKLTLPNVLFDTPQAVARHFDMPGLPVTLFIGADGKVRSTHVGEISREGLRAGVAQLLSE